MKCPHCEAINSSRRNHCGRCGAELNPGRTRGESRRAEKSSRHSGGRSASRPASRREESGERDAATSRQAQASSGRRRSARASSRRKIESHMALSIISTVLFCLPLGIAAIISSAQVDARLAAGDAYGAAEAAERAKFLAWLGIGIAGAAWLLYAIVIVASVISQ